MSRAHTLSRPLAPPAVARAPQFASLFDAEEWREFAFALPAPLGSVVALGWSQGGCEGLWSAAALHVVAAAPAVERLRSARRVLELGAGCGALGVACATRLGVPAGATVHLTDGDAREVHLLRANAERAGEDPACECAVVAQRLLWGAAAARESDIPAGACDVVLAAECCYVPEIVPLLAEVRRRPTARPRAKASLRARSPRVYTHTHTHAHTPAHTHTQTHAHTHTHTRTHKHTHTHAHTHTHTRTHTHAHTHTRARRPAALPLTRRRRPRPLAGVAPAQTLAHFLAPDGRAYVVNSFVSTTRTQAEVRECLEAALRASRLSWRELGLPTDERALRGAGRALYALEIWRA